jgi:hypothetical protein
MMMYVRLKYCFICIFQYDKQCAPIIRNVCRYAHDQFASILMLSTIDHVNNCQCTINGQQRIDDFSCCMCIDLMDVGADNSALSQVNHCFILYQLFLDRFYCTSSIIMSTTTISLFILYSNGGRIW